MNLLMRELTSTKKRGRGTVTILALFVVLFGAGVFVYGVAHGRPAMPDSVRHREARARMVDEQIAGRDVTDERVLAAMHAVPRHLFVPESQRASAYQDRPLPIGEGQTISQPYIVAAMAQLAKVGPKDRVLEIGTGSGYGAAVLGKLAKRVTSVEIVPALAARAKEVLGDLGYTNVDVHVGDGYAGHPDGAPYDAIVVTAAPTEVPPALIAQLAIGGRLVIPVGGAEQRLELYERTADGIEKYRVFDVSFVPMTGRAQRAGR